MSEIKIEKFDASSKDVSQNVSKLSENMTQKQLIQALRAISKNQSKTQVAQQIAQADIKERNVKDFIAKKSLTELNDDKRQVIKERRAYMMNETSKDNFTIYNATMFRDEHNKLVMLTQAVADKLVNDFVAKLSANTKFKAEAIRNAYKSCGGAYGDKFRKAQYAISMLCTEKQASENFEEMKAQALAKNKVCIYYNIADSSSRRIVYEFIKL